jgi:23S rRNA (cytidine1920-2'-O)/16S rRNA (cytidine1409-2'-O)-methyltransferase
MAPMKRIPAWRLLVDRGLAPDRRAAEALALTGRVVVAGCRLDKPGTPVPADAEAYVRGEGRYASRGGEKLAAALDGFALDVAGRVALDAGASTGGFTDCLLQRGAARVFAVDAGFGQLLGRLRADPRVVTLERTNIAELTTERLGGARPDLCTLDLSYLSLRDAWGHVLPVLAEAADLLCLVKPLFETSRAELRRTGRIGDPAVYREVLLDLGRAAHGLGLLGVVPSPVPLRHGVREFMLWARKGAPAAAAWPDLVEAALSRL